MQKCNRGHGNAMSGHKSLVGSWLRALLECILGHGKVIFNCETFHTVKTFFFLAASQLKVKRFNPFQEHDQFLKYCTIVTRRA